MCSDDWLGGPPSQRAGLPVVSDLFSRELEKVDFILGVAPDPAHLHLYIPVSTHPSAAVPSLLPRTPSNHPAQSYKMSGSATQPPASTGSVKLDALKQKTEAAVAPTQLSGLNLYSRFAFAGAVCCSVTHGGMTPVDV